jgi:hypothetical protein
MTALKGGWSEHPDFRAENIAKGFPFKVVDYKLIATVEGVSKAIENQFHSFMSHYRLNSECYQDTTASRSCVRDWFSRTSANLPGFHANFLAKP